MSCTATAATTSNHGSTSHTRSLGGCLTCRSRKVKCDERQPLCRQCVRGGLFCGGYKAKIRFKHYRPAGGDPSYAEPGDKDTGSGRRLLFTAGERESMSRHILDRVAVHGDVDQILDHLDTFPAHHSQIQDGPFNVFRLGDCVAAAERGESSQSWQFLEDDPAPSIPADVENAINLPTLSGAMDDFNLDIFNGILVPDNSDSAHLLPPFDVSTVQTIGVAAQERQHAETVEALRPQPQHDLQQASYSNIPSQSHYLLEHYKSLVTKTFSPIRKRKSPWSILHLPRAMLALAEISIFRTTQHAHTSLFYSVLAVSAFNMDNVHRRHSDGTTYWKSIGDGFRRAAQASLQSTCEVEASGKSQSKYKDVLMAILSMVTISVVSGQQEEARSYLLNAEMFICLRGIAKAEKSKKVKLLHWIYLFLRIIQESTHVYDLTRQPTINLCIPTEDMKLPSLRTHSKNLGINLDYDVGGDFEHGLFGDLEDSRNGLLFQTIYGLPFQLLSFISRTTFLANEILALRYQDSEASTTPEIERRCVALETEVCSWSDENNSVPDLDEDEDAVSTLVNRTIMTHLIAAFHNAVIIFFYRRVRNLNPLLLQPLAEKTLAHLQSFEQEQQRFSVCNCEIVWPAFIAGAEAMDRGLQDRFDHHLRDCASRSGMRNFETAADFLLELWEARRKEKNAGMTWLELMTAKKVSLIFT